MIIKHTADVGLATTPLERIPVGDATYAWDVPADLQPSDMCAIYVCVYYRQSIFGQSGVFSLVEHGNDALPYTVLKIKSAPDESMSFVYALNGRRIGYQAMSANLKPVVLIHRLFGTLRGSFL